ncbi:hypothetical protein ACFFRR_007681 [Megaselia abdita]
MLVDTGAQVSLINNKLIKNPNLINTKNRISISSIHGSEKTLGKLTTTINQGNVKIPIILHVTNNSTLKEDGILGFDVIGQRAIIDGPRKLVTMNSGITSVQFPINNKKHIQINALKTDDNIDDELAALNKIEHISMEEGRNE